jgi:hypothetical protein
MKGIFVEEFKPKSIIDNPSEEKLGEWSLEQGGIVTEFGNLSVITAEVHEMGIKFRKG